MTSSLVSPGQHELCDEWVFFKKDTKYLSAPKLLNEKIENISFPTPKFSLHLSPTSGETVEAVTLQIVLCMMVKCEIPQESWLRRRQICIPQSFSLPWLDLPLVHYSGHLLKAEQCGRRKWGDVRKEREICFISLPSRSSEGTLEWEGRDSGGIALPPPTKDNEKEDRQGTMLGNRLLEEERKVCVC